MTVDNETWLAFVRAAADLNEYRAPEPPSSSGSGEPAGAGAPGSDFNRRGTWADTGLIDAGWVQCRGYDAAGDRGFLTRPGKSSGVSASAGTVTATASGNPLFYCFSTSTDFTPGIPYSRFGVYATLRHGGDYAAAAKALRAEGYGEESADPLARFDPPRIVIVASGDGVTRLFKWMSELTRPIESNDKWLWEGYLSRGTITLFNALWKSGKSTVLAHLLKHLDGRHGDFLGQPVKPCRVLYVTEELEEDWADRRDDLGIGDHVGLIVRPFKGRPSAAQWVAFINSIRDAAVEHQFDCVVFDTLSKLWPVRDENDAGQVEDALRAFWVLVERPLSLSIMVVHHNRKSGGGEFTGSRGSGSLPSFVDIIMEFARHSEDARDCRRVITAGGRYKQTPHKLLAELTPAGYLGHGDPNTPGVRATFVAPWQSAAFDRVPAGLPGVSADELIDALQAAGQATRLADVLAWLAARVNDGEIVRVGRGVRGSPYRFHRVGEVDPTEPGDSFPP